MDDDDRADDAVCPESTGKHSKRDRLKGALARTKSKFKKENDRPKEANLPDDVNDFLAAGRSSTSSWTRGSLGDTLPHPPVVNAVDGQSASAPSALPRPSTSDSNTQSFASPRSPKKIPIPKIDISNAQRWPHAQPVGTNEQDFTAFLRPEYHGRSQSVSSFSNKSKKKGRARGLSVSFIDAPPVIIGEGGDDAPTPPVEISRARQRARSASPMASRSQFENEASMNGTYTKGPGPFAPPPRQAHPLPDVLRPRILQRAQRGGFAEHSSGASGLDKEFERTLRRSPHANSPASVRGSTPNTPEIVAPKPVRVVQPPSVFEEPNESAAIKKGVPSSNLREKFREGDALRMHLEKETPDLVDDIRKGRPLPRSTNQEQQEASKWI